MWQNRTLARAPAHPAQPPRGQFGNSPREELHALSDPMIFLPGLYVTGGIAHKHKE